MKRLGISKIDNELRRLDDGLTFSDITSTTVLSTTNIHTTKPSSKQKKFLLKI